MSRNFSGVVTEGVALGTADLFDATLGAWSFLAFARVENTVDDARTIISKWSSGSNRNFWVYFSIEAAPSRLIIGMNADTNIAASAEVVQLDTWYLIVVTNDGTGDAGSLTIDLIEMDENFLVDGDTADPLNELGTVETIRIGRRSTNQDPFDGDLAHVCYVSKVVTRDEKVAYLRNPWRVARVWAVSPGVEFYAPLGIGSPEPDFTKAVSYAISGSPTISAMSPTGRFTDISQAAPLIEEGAPPTGAPYYYQGLIGYHQH